MEAALAKSFAADALSGIEIDASTLNSDIHGSAEYRANLVGVMAGGQSRKPHDHRSETEALDAAAAW